MGNLSLERLLCPVKRWTLGGNTGQTSLFVFKWNPNRSWMSDEFEYVYIMVYVQYIHARRCFVLFHRVSFLVCSSCADVRKCCWLSWGPWASEKKTKLPNHLQRSSPSGWFHPASNQKQHPSINLLQHLPSSPSFSQYGFNLLTLSTAIYNFVVPKCFRACPTTIYSLSASKPSAHLSLQLPKTPHLP